MLVNGMLGLGDNLHQRAVIRQLMLRNEVWLQTPWPSVYHDLVGARLHVVSKQSKLRTQQKNIDREKDKFEALQSRHGRVHRIWYRHDQIKSCGGFLAAMCHNSGLPKGDFSLPVPQAWRNKALQMVGKTDRPIMVYRPLVDRREWDGCNQRNPDGRAYVELARSIKDRFFVVSIADLEQGKEWAVSESIEADLEFHRGELDFETMAGLFDLAGLVYCSPGFALVLAQAVGAPLVAVFGGHESARLYSHGSETDLFVEPVNPCECFSKSHRCDKTIDMALAKSRVTEFIQGQE